MDDEAKQHLDAMQRARERHQHNAERNTRKSDRLDRQLRDDAIEQHGERGAKVRAAVSACVVECTASTTPFTCLTQWIAKLARQAWATDELSEFQSLVLRALMERERSNT